MLSVYVAQSCRKLLSLRRASRSGRAFSVPSSRMRVPAGNRAMISARSAGVRMSHAAGWQRMAYVSRDVSAYRSKRWPRRVNLEGRVPYPEIRAGEG